MMRWPRMAAVAVSLDVRCHRPGDRVVTRTRGLPADPPDRGHLPEREGSTPHHGSANVRVVDQREPGPDRVVVPRGLRRSGDDRRDRVPALVRHEHQCVEVLRQRLGRHRHRGANGGRPGRVSSAGLRSLHLHVLRADRLPPRPRRHCRQADLGDGPRNVGRDHPRPRSQSRARTRVDVRVWQRRDRLPRCGVHPQRVRRPHGRHGRRQQRGAPLPRFQQVAYRLDGRRQRRHRERESDAHDRSHCERARGAGRHAAHPGTAPGRYALRDRATRVVRHRHGFLGRVGTQDPGRRSQRS